MASGSTQTLSSRHALKFAWEEHCTVYHPFAITRMYICARIHIAERILNALNKTQETDMKNYCESCLWEEANRKCDGLMPVCGGKEIKFNHCTD